MGGAKLLCVALTLVLELPLLPHATWRPDSIGFYSNCGGPASIWIRETLPLGWGDTYFQSVPGQSFDITDGYHDNLVMAPNNQLFIASRGCTNVIATSTTPARGCLSVLNTGGGTIYTAAQNGDVTGIQPILNRSVVYVCEGGAFAIYDTALDLGTQGQLKPQTTTEITIVGQPVDVKLVDF